MEMPETEVTATKRPVWNVGRTVGAKRALIRNGVVSEIATDLNGNQTVASKGWAQFKHQILEQRTLVHRNHHLLAETL